MRNEWGVVTIEKRAEILNHEPLQLRLAAQIHQEWHIQYPENLETSILGLGELEHMNKLYVSGMLQRIMNYNAGKASFTFHYSMFSYPQLAFREWPHSFLCPLRTFNRGHCNFTLPVKLPKRSTCMACNTWQRQTKCLLVVLRQSFFRSTSRSVLKLISWVGSPCSLIFSQLVVFWNCC